MAGVEDPVQDGLADDVLENSGYQSAGLLLELRISDRPGRPTRSVSSS